MRQGVRTVPNRDAHVASRIAVRLHDCVRAHPSQGYARCVIPQRGVMFNWTPGTQLTRRDIRDSYSTLQALWPQHTYGWNYTEMGRNGDGPVLVYHLTWDSSLWASMLLRWSLWRQS
jgi:hypothetical protein